MAISERWEEVTVLSGNTASPPVAIPLRHSVVGIITSDGATGSFFVEVAEHLGGTFKRLQTGNPGADIQLTVGRAIVLTDMPYTAVRVQSDLAQSEDRLFIFVSKPR